MPDAKPDVQRHQRLAVRLPIRVSTIDSELDPETGKAYYRASDEVCQNVSRGGAFVMTREPVKPGSRVLLELELPGEESMQAIGRVAWSRVQLTSDDAETRCGIGVEFLGGSPEQLSALERYINRATRRSRTPGVEPVTAIPRPVGP
jgi:uncharacterized protein (TIGR02266 family)